MISFPPARVLHLGTDSLPVTSGPYHRASVLVTD